MLAFLFGVVALASASASNTSPEQIHLAFAGKDESGHPTGMRVAWYTEELPGSISSVAYGTSPGTYTSKVNSSRSPIVYFKNHGYHHVVDVTSLEPNTKYYYVVGGANGPWSSEHHWQTPKTGHAADTASISLAIFGDMGYEDSDKRPMILGGIDGLERHWSATFSRDRLLALKDGLDGIWHLGDIGYADDGFAHDPVFFQYEHAYNGFMNWIQGLSATMPYMVSPGNHESECHGLWCSVTHLWDKHNVLGNFSAYNARWHMPSAESGGHPASAMWYSWNQGPVHFVSINTETDFPGAEEFDTGDSHDKKMPAGHFGSPGQYLRWLEADLKAAFEIRTRAMKGGAGQRWIVVGGHRPYGSIKGAHTDLFHKYAVDMYFSGHTHSYVRSAPINGTVYIVAGGAGCDEMPLPHSSADVDPVRTCTEDSERDRRQGSCKVGYVAPQGTIEYSTHRMAIGVLHADPKQLRWQLYDSVNGSILDEVNVTAKEDMVVV